jgi:ATP-dependent helicase/nuclease subunit A
LTALPLYEMVETLIRMFELTLKKGEWAFIQGFLDQVLAFSQKERGEIERFLEWWHKSGKNCSIQMPEDVDAAKVLTIHKSKGLQFKVVILTFCNWELDHNPLFDNIIWCESEKPPFNMLKCLPVKYTGALSDTLFGREYFEEKIKTAIDNLNLLYVAVTRAREQLFISGCLPVENSKKEMPFKTVSDLLFQVMSRYVDPEPSSQYQFLDLNQHWDPANAVFEAGTKIKKQASAAIQDNRSPLINFISTDWRKRISIKYSSREYTDEPGTREEKIKFGKLVHRILAQTRIHSDLPKILKEFYYEGIIDSGELKTLQNKLKIVFENEQLRDWFSDRYKIKIEAPVLQPGGGVLRPDRVMIDGDKAVALDFKTGKSGYADHTQVREYMFLLREMGYEQIEGYLLYLDNLEIVKVDNL